MRSTLRAAGADETGRRHAVQYAIARRSPFVLTLPSAIGLLLRLHGGDHFGPTRARPIDAIAHAVRRHRRARRRNHQHRRVPGFTEQPGLVRLAQQDRRHAGVQRRDEVVCRRRDDSEPLDVSFVITVSARA